MTGWLRRNWIPTVGMAAAIAFVAWLGWINVRGGSGRGVVVPTGTPSPSVSLRGPSATPSPTADPAVAEAESAAKAWIQAYYDSYRTGDASVLNGMADPGSDADGQAGTPRASVLSSHRTVVLAQLTYQAVDARVVGDVASVDLSYTTVTVPSEWPSLKATGTAQTRTWQDHMALTRMNGKWFIDSFD